MKVYVHVRGSVIPLECGDGTQEVSWLGNAAMVHVDRTFGKRFSTPTAIKKDGGVRCNPTALVCETLDNNQHVFVEFAGSEL